MTLRYATCHQAPRVPRGALLFLLCAVLGAGPIACKEREAEHASDPDLGEVSAPDMGEARTRGDAFGLPLPPRVRSIERTEDHIFVTTDLKLPEIEAFFKKNLVDYEVLTVGSSLRIIPLREQMPWVRVTRPFGPRYPIHVTYISANVFSAAAADAIAEGAPGAPRKTLTPKPVPPEAIPRQGEPVMLRTPSGQLLAPGARWGEPYTPPPGSPLHTERNRMNFGRPFGDWRAD